MIGYSYSPINVFGPLLSVSKLLFLLACVYRMYETHTYISIYKFYHVPDCMLPSYDVMKKPHDTSQKNITPLIQGILCSVVTSDKPIGILISSCLVSSKHQCSKIVHTTKHKFMSIYTCACLVLIREHS